MEIYDSSIETLAHINMVGINIDKFCDALLSKKENYKLISQMSLLGLVGDRIYDFMGDNVFIDKILDNNWTSYGSNNPLTPDFVVNELQIRKKEHDKSKLKEPEKTHFDIWTPKLNTCSYNNKDYKLSDEYKQFLLELKIALDHHYAIYRHHPQHFPNGIHDMNIIDLIEMLLDWDAACKRHNDGNIYVSIKTNQERFGYCNGLAKVFVNTIDRYFAK